MERDGHGMSDGVDGRTQHGEVRRQRSNGRAGVLHDVQSGSATVILNVADLETCDRTRVRKQRPNENSDIVEEYADSYRCGLIVEPLDVFRERDTERYIVADGEHRLLALRRANVKQVECRLHEGDEIAALDFAIGCNHAHGLRITKKDRYHMFERIMDTPLKDKYRTDTELSEKLGVSKRMISNYKVDWRNSQGGNKEAKQQAKDTAKKKTRKDLKGKPKVTPEQEKVAKQVRWRNSQGGNKEAKQQAKDTAKKKTRKDLKGKPKVTPEQEKVAKQVRESTKRQEPPKSEWTAADEHALKALKREWARATDAARKRFCEEMWG